MKHGVQRPRRRARSSARTRAPASGAGGPGFKSRRARHLMFSTYLLALLLREYLSSQHSFNDDVVLVFIVNLHVSIPDDYK